MKENTHKYAIITAVAVLITALIVGGGVYFWQQSITERNEASLRQQIEELERSEANLSQQIEELEKSEANLSQQIEELERRLCKGTWVNGVCIQKTCVDSDVNEKPDDIYIKGSVTFSDESGLSTTVYDECNGARTQVNEMWCYESPKGSGNYVPGRMVYDCPNGCFDGACIRDE